MTSFLIFIKYEKNLFEPCFRNSGIYIQLVFNLCEHWVPLAQSAGAAEYTASLQRSKTLPITVLDMTLNNLMVRFQ